MKVQEHREGRTRRFDIVLNRHEYDALDAGCPDASFLASSLTQSGVQFLFFTNPTGFSPSFRPMPDGDGYFYNVDLPYTPGRTARDLERAIARTGDIPIEMDAPHGGTPINLGYVTLTVEEA